MKDIGLTHIALQITDVERSIAFYARYATMKIVHERVDEESGKRISRASCG